MKVLIDHENVSIINEINDCKCDYIGNRTVEASISEIDQDDQVDQDDQDDRL